jgi:hypothetical protein
MQTGATTMAANGVVLGRRGFLLGLGAAIAAPAIVRAASLMPVRVPRLLRDREAVMRAMVELLSQANDILDDIVFEQALRDYRESVQVPSAWLRRAS